MNGTVNRPPSSQGTIDEDAHNNQRVAAGESKPTRKADPMSFSNILSNDVPEPPKSTPRAVPSSKPSKNVPSTVDRNAKSSLTPARKQASKSTAYSKEAVSKTSIKTEVERPALVQTPSNKRKNLATFEKQNERVQKEMDKIDAMEKGDIESAQYEDVEQFHTQTSQKRQRDIETADDIKRKVCCIASAQ